VASEELKQKIDNYVEIKNKFIIFYFLLITNDFTTSLSIQTKIALSIPPADPQEILV
jgi:hypothetical protein